MNRYLVHKTSLLVAGLACGFVLGMPAVVAGTVPQAQTHDAATGAAVSDRGITAKVRQRLGETESLRDADIGVTTVNGVVTLSGTVSDHQEKLAAAALAIQVQGVKVLDNELMIASGNKPGADPKATRPARYRAVPDSRVTADVQELLATSLPSRYKVDVKTIKGVVYLRGDLKDQDAITRIKGLVAEVDGVKSVNTSELDAPYVAITY